MPSSGYACHVFDEELDGEWIRLKSNEDCRATAFFHYWSPREAEDGEASIFESLASVGSSSDSSDYTGGLIRPAEHNRSLQWLLRSVSSDGETLEPEYVEIELDGTAELTFTRPKESRADEMDRVARIASDYQVDAASVIVTDAGGRRYRLPKGDEAFDHPPRRRSGPRYPRVRF